MSRNVIVTIHAPHAIGPYSQGIRFDNLVFCSGQLPVDASGAMPADIIGQTRLSLKNLKAVLQEGGAKMESVGGLIRKGQFSYQFQEQ